MVDGNFSADFVPFEAVFFDSGSIVDPFFFHPTLHESSFPSFSATISADWLPQPGSQWPPHLSARALVRRERDRLSSGARNKKETTARHVVVGVSSASVRFPRHPQPRKTEQNKKKKKNKRRTAIGLKKKKMVIHLQARTTATTTTTKRTARLICSDRLWRTTAFHVLIEGLLGFTGFL